MSSYSIVSIVSFVLFLLKLIHIFGKLCKLAWLLKRLKAIVRNLRGCSHSELEALHVWARKMLAWDNTATISWNVATLSHAAGNCHHQPFPPSALDSADATVQLHDHQNSWIIAAGIAACPILSRTSQEIPNQWSACKLQTHSNLATCQKSEDVVRG